MERERVEEENQAKEYREKEGEKWLENESRIESGKIAENHIETVRQTDRQTAIEEDRMIESFVD